MSMSITKVVYFGRMKTTDDERVQVKIGCTSDISELKSKFPRMKILNVFQCYHNDSFVEFLHGHKDISPYKIKYSRGVFCMAEEDLKRAVNIATRNVLQFRVYVNEGDSQSDFDEVIKSHPTMIAICEKLGVDLNP